MERLRLPRRKTRPVGRCKGKSWTCIAKWVGGWNGALCKQCNEYAVAVIAAHERKRAEKRESGLTDIRVDRFNALAKVVEPITNIDKHHIAAE